MSRPTHYCTECFNLQSQLDQANAQLNAAGNTIDILREEIAILRDMVDAAVERQCKCGED